MAALRVISGFHKDDSVAGDFTTLTDPSKYISREQPESVNTERKKLQVHFKTKGVFTLHQLLKSEMIMWPGVIFLITLINEIAPAGCQ